MKRFSSARVCGFMALVAMAALLPLSAGAAERPPSFFAEHLGEKTPAVATPPRGQDSSARLQYSIGNFGVVFSQHRIEEPLYMRTYRVEPDVIQGLEGMSVGVGATGQESWSGISDLPLTIKAAEGEEATRIQNALRSFFEAAGVAFSTNSLGAATGQVSPPEKGIFFNARTGVLFLRATRRDLGIIEEALQNLHISQPRVDLMVRSISFRTAMDRAAFVEVVTDVHGFRRVLTEAEVWKLLAVVEGAGGYFVTPFPKVTTVSGRACRAGVGDQVVDLRPVYKPSDQTITVQGAAFKLNDSARKLAGRGVVRDGQTYILGHLPEEIPVFPGFAGKPDEPIFLITAELVDPAGKRVIGTGKPNRDLPTQVP